MSPKYRHEPEAREEQAKNYPSRYEQHGKRPTKRVHKKDLQWYSAMINQLKSICQQTVRALADPR